MLEVEVIKFYPFELPGRRSGIVGYADIKLGDYLVIRTVRLVRNRHGGYYVQMPTLSVRDKSYDIVEVLSKELMESIRRKVVDYYREKIKI